MQCYCNVADVAAYFLLNEETEFDDQAHGAFAYFLKAEEELLHYEVDVKEADQALDTWRVDLLDILDDYLPNDSAHYANNAIVPAVSFSYPGPDTYGSVQFLLPDLQEITDTLTLFSCVSPYQQLLLDIRVPRSIYS